MSQQVPEIEATTMVDDRRLYAVGTEKFRILEEAIEYTKMMKRWVTSSKHASVWKAIWETLVQIPGDLVTLRHVPAHLGWSDLEAGILISEDWKLNMAPATYDERECAEETHDPECTDGCCPHGGTTILISHQRQS